MKDKLSTIVGVCCAIASSSSVFGAARDADRLVLADHGTTQYRIVIGKDATDAENYAAKELALFLKQMTGATFPVARDDAPAGEFEIVLGNTNRRSMAQIPQTLTPQKLEGFALVRDGATITIMGNIPRGTLYGVYDFLELELGVRFLARDVNHVPDRPTLRPAVASRRYDPPIEYRNISKVSHNVWNVRNRLNAMWSMVPMEKMLGGVRWVGPSFVHTFSSMVPVEKYFDEHPEYFSEIDGVRVREKNGVWTQLCMTNPDVLRLCTEAVRQWGQSAVEANPYNKLVASVTINDSTNFCKCAPCVAVNKEEGVIEGGTLLRFVNAIATQMAKELPNLTIETVVYHTQMPLKTQPVANLMIRNGSGIDWKYRLDDPSSPRNVKQLEHFRDLKRIMKDGIIYDWSKHMLTFDYLTPNPNLRHITDNIRIMNEQNVEGMYFQIQNNLGTDMYDLRNYLLAKGVWRPQTNNRQAMEEFCRLFYGKAGDDVLAYVDFLHDEYIVDHDLWEQMRDTMNPSLVYDEAFLAKADAILARAESKADTPETKLRVATMRLEIWHQRLERAYGEVGRFVSFPVVWGFEMDPQDEGLDHQWQKTTDFDAWKTMRIDKHWTLQGEQRRGVAWYGINFKMPAKKGARLALYFGAVDGTCDVFIDGRKVGEQKGNPGFTWQHSFFVPLADGLAPGEHTLVLRVYKPNWNAGMWKPVRIVEMAAPISDDLRTAGKRFTETARAIEMTHISSYYVNPWGVQMDKLVYPKIAYFLTHGTAAN